ncbi:MAG: glycosyltransferase family 4 protein [Chloroflexi bacterium]|nr:glycosyltransferase family 4 protein [Chloroflexota bacterium]
MRIAIDALGITQPGGGRSATLNLLTALFQIDQENAYLLFVDEREQALTAPHVRQYATGVKGRFAARLWAQLALPIILRKERVDLVHYAKNLGAFFTPGATVVTVYDLSILICPDVYPWSDRIYWRFIEPLTLQQAQRIIAISEDTARDIVTYYKIPRERIQVIYPGCDPRFRPLPAEEVARVKQKYHLPDTFILHVGSISRKKNLLTLARAIASLRKRGVASKLVLVGRIYEKARDDALFRYIQEEKLSDEVIWLGAVPDADLVAIYNCATVLAFPSLQEGFGLVPLEAMSCGLPIVTSGSGAIREVIGNAGMIVDNPKDEAEWACILEHVLRDRSLQAQLRLQGLERARRFSNEEAAKQVLQLYHQVVGK